MLDQMVDELPRKGRQVVQPPHADLQLAHSPRVGKPDDADGMARFQPIGHGTGQYADAGFGLHHAAQCFEARYLDADVEADAHFRGDVGHEALDGASLVERDAAEPRRLGEVNDLPGSKRMIAGDGKDEAVFLIGDDLQLVGPDVAGEYADIDRPFRNGAGNVRAEALLQVDVDMRVRGEEGGERGRQYLGYGRRVGEDAHLALQAAREDLQVAVEPFEIPEHPARVDKQRLAGRRERDTLAETVQERRAQRILQVLDAHRCGADREMHALRPSRQVLRLGNADEEPQVHEVIAKAGHQLSLAVRFRTLNAPFPNNELRSATPHAGWHAKRSFGVRLTGGDGMNDAPQTSWSAELAAFAAGLRYEDIPDPVVDRAVDLFVDWVGSALAGKGMRPIEIVSSFARTMGPESGPSEILIDGSSSSPLFAAFVNGASSPIAEPDDVHNGSVFHPAAVVFPPALAVAQAIGASGRDFMAAVTAGYEVGIRVGEFLGRSHYKIFHTTGTAGALAAAAATGRLLGLSADAMRDAFGSAGTQAAGLWEFLR